MIFDFCEFSGTKILPDLKIEYRFIYRMLSFFSSFLIYRMLTWFSISNNRLTDSPSTRLTDSSSTIYCITMTRISSIITTCTPYRRLRHMRLWLVLFGLFFLYYFALSAHQWIEIILLKSKLNMQISA